MRYGVGPVVDQAEQFQLLQREMEPTAQMVVVVLVVHK
jgi:hypothetical protein